jgi:hypothetical protein
MDTNQLAEKVARELAHELLNHEHFFSCGANTYEDCFIQRIAQAINEARLEQCKTIEQMFADGFTVEEVKRYLIQRLAELQQSVERKGWA